MKRLDNTADQKSEYIAKVYKRISILKQKEKLTEDELVELQQLIFIKWDLIIYG